jgi:hypothetical protein
MPPTLTWHGTEQEGAELLQAIGRNCTCRVQRDPRRVECCASHRLLIGSQRILDGLLFARRVAPRLRAEEWRTT